MHYFSMHMRKWHILCVRMQQQQNEKLIMALNFEMSVSTKALAQLSNLHFSKTYSRYQMEEIT